jgi:hypothetical protein
MGHFAKKLVIAVTCTLFAMSAACSYEKQEGAEGAKEKEQVAQPSGEAVKAAEPEAKPAAEEAAPAEKAE